MGNFISLIFEEIKFMTKLNLKFTVKVKKLIVKRKHYLKLLKLKKIFRFWRNNQGKKQRKQKFKEYVFKIL